MFPTIEIVSLATASKRLLSTTTGGTYTGLISIGDPGSKLPSGYNKVDSRIRLEFDDVLNDNNRNYIAPAITDVQRIVNFAERVSGQPGKILIHCFAGISRSSATGFVCNSVWFGPGQESQALVEALSACAENCPCPNELMVKIADRLLERDGAMLRAWDELFGCKGVY